MSRWYYILQAVLKFFTQTIERPSPSDIVPVSAVKVEGDTIKINLKALNIPFSLTPRVWIPLIPGTNSMDGAFDYGNNNILIAGADATDHEVMIDFIEVGDVVVYNSPSRDCAIIHRIIQKGEDAEGRWFRFKGDNNASADPEKVRDSQIKWLSIGTIY